MSIISDNWEAEIGGWWFENTPGKKVGKTPPQGTIWML
jgi:hypothetical protein